MLASVLEDGLHVAVTSHDAELVEKLLEFRIVATGIAFVIGVALIFQQILDANAGIVQGRLIELLVIRLSFFL